MIFNLKIKKTSLVLNRKFSVNNRQYKSRLPYNYNISSNNLDNKKNINVQETMDDILEDTRDIRNGENLNNSDSDYNFDTNFNTVNDEYQTMTTISEDENKKCSYSDCLQKEASSTNNEIISIKPKQSEIDVISEELIIDFDNTNIVIFIKNIINNISSAFIRITEEIDEITELFSDLSPCLYTIKYIKLCINYSPCLISYLSLVLNNMTPYLSTFNSFEIYDVYSNPNIDYNVEINNTTEDFMFNCLHEFRIFLESIGDLNRFTTNHSMIYIRAELENIIFNTADTIDNLHAEFRDNFRNLSGLYSEMVGMFLNIISAFETSISDYDHSEGRFIIDELHRIDNILDEIINHMINGTEPNQAESYNNAGNNSNNVINENSDNNTINGNDVANNSDNNINTNRENFSTDI